MAVLTGAEDPDVDIDRFIKATDKEAFISERLRTAAGKIRAVDIDDVPRLKQAIAWSIAASAEHPTLTGP